MSQLEMKKEHKEPLVRIAKRTELPKKEITKLRLMALLLSLVAGGLFLLCLRQNPFVIYGTIISGAFRSKMAVQATVKFMIPLFITSLGLAVAFKMLFWNIGAEGQIIMGAIAASYFALFHADWPRPVLLIVMLIAGMIGGGLWGLIPAFFKTKYNTNETLFTLMLNYIALYIISYLRDGPWRDPANPGFAKIATFDSNACLPKVFGVHIGWIIGLIIFVLVYIYMNKTKHGFEISVVGSSHATATYAGMNVPKIMLRTVFISGAICGIAGMTQATGSDLTLAAGVAGGVGFTAIIVAWLSNLNPITIFIVSLLFSVLEKGSSVIQSSYGLSTDCSDVLQGIILFFILGCEFFVRYKFTFRKKDDTLTAAAEGGAN